LSFKKLFRIAFACAGALKAIQRSFQRLRFELTFNTPVSPGITESFVILEPTIGALRLFQVYPGRSCSMLGTILSYRAEEAQHLVCKIQSQCRNIAEAACKLPEMSLIEEQEIELKVRQLTRHQAL